MNARGFTLLEILVALVVLGLLVAGLAQATHFGIQSWHTEQRLTERDARLERVARTLRDLVEHARPAMSSDDKPFTGEAHRLVFLTRLPDQPQAGPRRAQVAIGVDDSHQLVLRWQPHPNAIALQPLAPPETIVLADGIDHLDVTYRDAATDKAPIGAWHTSWDRGELPALVQFHLAPVSGHRPWPDLVASPMIDPNGSF
jgi:general secretion pathway protein J